MGMPATAWLSPKLTLEIALDNFLNTYPVSTYYVFNTWRCIMPNITISIDEKLLKSGREYAKKHHTSVNALIRNLLEQTVKTDSTQWLDECFALMDRANICSKGKRWKREDLYDV